MSAPGVGKRRHPWRRARVSAVTLSAGGNISDLWGSDRPFSPVLRGRYATRPPGACIAPDHTPRAGVRHRGGRGCSACRERDRVRAFEVEGEEPLHWRRPLVRCHLAELPQGLTAARAGELWQVHEGSLHAPRPRARRMPPHRRDAPVAPAEPRTSAPAPASAESAPSSATSDPGRGISRTAPGGSPASAAAAELPSVEDDAVPTPVPAHPHQERTMSPTAASPASSLLPSSIAPRPDLGRVAAFLGIALSVTAALSLLVAAGILPTATVGLIVPLAQLSPLLAALLVRRRDEPRREALGLAVPSWRLMLLASLGAVAAFVMVPLARVLIGLGAGAPPLTDPAPVQGLLLAVPSVLLLQALLAIGEETGW